MGNIKSAHRSNNKITPIWKYSSLLLLASALLSTTCSSAQRHELQIFDYTEAMHAFQEQKHDTPGVWICSYIAHNRNTNTPEDTKILILEVDEKYLYIKNNNRIEELELTSRAGKKEKFTSAQTNSIIELTIVKRSNFSEYQESHDRIVNATIKGPEGNYSLQLFGEACGI